MNDPGRPSRRGVTEERRPGAPTAAERDMGRQGRGSRVTRRQALARIGSAGAGVVLAPTGGWAGAGLEVAGRAGVVVAAAVSASTLRLSVLPEGSRGSDPIPLDGALVDGRWSPEATLSPTGVDEAAVGDFVLRVDGGPPTIRIGRADGRIVQTIGIDEASGSATFDVGKGPLFGMGQGGPQFDRRGAAYSMRSGQGGYELHTHGAVVPIQWLVSSDGWVLYVHQPLGTFDLRGERGRFAPPEGAALPLDLFVVDAPDPAATMGEWARLTGRPEMPPLWSLGYQQSHRTLSGPEEVRWVARTLRDERLPCDTLIYLGTGFCPSGWNTQNGEFTWNPQTFPDPQTQLEELHAMGFKVVVHVVLEGKRLIGTVSDPCPDPPGPGETESGRSWPDEQRVACYWPIHRKVLEQGVDGWWPDQGDGLDAESRLARIRMYYEGTQRLRPGERPFALHRNGYAGMARYAAFLWSGDVYSTWETLRTHVSVALSAPAVPLHGGTGRARHGAASHASPLAPLPGRPVGGGAG